MIDFTFSWILTTIFIILSFYFYSKMFFFKTLLLKSKEELKKTRNKSLNDSAVIEIFETEIKKNKNNLNYLEKELIEALVIVKEYKNLNQRYKTDLVESEDKIKTMKNKLDMLF